MVRWISYGAVALLVMTAGVAVFQPSTDRLAGTWVLDAEAVQVEGAEAERVATVQLLTSMQLRVTFTPGRMTVEMNLLGEKRTSWIRPSHAD